MNKKALIDSGVPEAIAEIILGEREISTLKEAVKVYKYSTGEVQKKALAKADELMTTYEKAHLVYEHSKGELKKLALKRSGELWESLEGIHWAYSGMF